MNLVYAIVRNFLKSMTKGFLTNLNMKEGGRERERENVGVRKRIEEEEDSSPLKEITT